MPDATNQRTSPKPQEQAEPKPPTRNAALRALMEMSESLASATSLLSTYDAALDALFSAVGATRASVSLFDEAGVTRTVASRGLSSPCKSAAEGHTPWTAGQRGAKAFRIADATTDETLGAFREALLGEGVRSLAFVPLVVRAGVIGKLMLCRDEARAFSDEELDLAEAIAAIVAFAVDRWRAERMLIAERSMFVAGPVVTFKWRVADGWPVEYASPNAAATFGIDAADFLSGRVRYSTIIHPDDLSRVADEVTTHLAAGRDRFEQQYRMVRPDGRVVWLQDYTTVLRNSKGTPVSLLGYVVDETERQADAERTRRDQQRLRAVFEQAAVGIAEVSPDGRFLAVNPKLCQILGYSAAELLRLRFQDVTLPEDLPKNLALLRETLEGKQAAYELEKRYRRKDGGIVWCHIAVGLVRAPTGEIERLISVVVDITGRKELEERLALAQRLESIGRLAGGVAHDFNNILTVITGYATLAMSGLAASDPRREQIGHILAASGSAGALTRQLLAFARQQVMPATVVDVSAAVRASLPMVRRLLRADIEITEDLRATWRAAGDPGMVEQVLLNLASNAQDAMPTGGRLMIETADEANPAGPSHGEERPLGASVRLTVRDTGAGMDEATRARAFEPFFTTKPAGRGTGLGLSTVYGIVRQRGGTISVHTAPGRGAEFVIHLPRAMAPSAPAMRSEPARPPDAAAKTILLAEDQEAVRAIASRVLRDSGHEVLEARTGAEAIELASRHAGPIDLLLADAVMPGMSGAELASALRRTRPTLRVLITSGYTEDDLLRADLERSRVAFLPKPFTPDQLSRAVASLMHSPA